MYIIYSNVARYHMIVAFIRKKTSSVRKPLITMMCRTSIHTLQADLNELEGASQLEILLINDDCNIDIKGMIKKSAVYTTCTKIEDARLVEKLINGKWVDIIEINSTFS
jgi:hypothetical protein